MLHGTKSTSAEKKTSFEKCACEQQILFGKTAKENHESPSQLLADSWTFAVASFAAAVAVLVVVAFDLAVVAFVTVVAVVVVLAVEVLVACPVEYLAAEVLAVVALAASPVECPVVEVLAVVVLAAYPAGYLAVEVLVVEVLVAGVPAACPAEYLAVVGDSADSCLEESPAASRRPGAFLAVGFLGCRVVAVAVRKVRIGAC